MSPHGIRDLRTCRVHQIRGISVDWSDPYAAKFHRARQNDVRKKRYNLHLQYSLFWRPSWDPGPSSPILAVMYIRLRTTNAPNFVHFGQPVYEIPAAELC